MSDRSDQHPSATASEIRDRLRAFLRARFPAMGQRAADDDRSLLDEGIVDSLGILDIVTHLEEEWGLGVTDEELNPENFASVSALSAFVERKRS